MKDTVKTSTVCGFTGRQVETIYAALRKIIVDEYAEFDYPDYGGLSRTISKKFSPDQMDYLQGLVEDYTHITEKDVFSALVRGYS